MKKQLNIIAVGFIFLMMILVAISENLRGVFIPIFKQDFSINNTQVGYMLMVSSLGYIIFTFIGGILCEKIGQKKVYILGFIFMILSQSLLSVTYSYTVLLIGVFMLNIGLGLISIATNTLVPVLFLSFQAVLMNLTHFCYGLGAAIGPRTAGIMLYNGVSWRRIYFIVAILFALVFIFFLFIKFPERHMDRNKEKIEISNIFKDKLILFYIIGLGFYVFAEMGTGSWFVNFMVKNYNYNKDVSSYYLALFFGTFAIGRFLGGFIVQKTGYLNTVAISLLTALVLYTSGIFLGSKGTILISLSGFFFSITFPTVVLTISRVFRQNTSVITGTVITFTSFISMVLNLVIGYLNDVLGNYISYYLIPLSLLISITFISMVYVKTKSILVAGRGD